MKKILTSIMTVAMLFLAGLSFAPAAMAGTVDCSKVPASVKEAAGCSGNEDELPKMITSIVSAVIGAAGIVAVIFVVIGGVNYMTSAGDAGKVEKAKKTIIYALIGLVICALSFVIVNFVIAKLLQQ